ncbi:MAG: hypothetical protein GY765_23515 [bacterium]|nr:hypothetical protein [bacterium]
MKRRDFVSKTTCGIAALMATESLGADQNPKKEEQKKPRPPMRPINMEVEIFENSTCPFHKKGEKFIYPEHRGRICPWLMDSMNTMLRVLFYGGSLDWTYKGTPYEKVINLDGVTTEYVRCPDPTSMGVVAKITRTDNRRRKTPEKKTEKQPALLLIAVCVPLLLMYLPFPVSAAEFGHSLNLRTLNPAGNRLSGTIPADLGNLTKLSYLELHHNLLEGNIPADLGNLRNLTLAQ